jgi:uncharacterized protein
MKPVGQVCNLRCNYCYYRHGDQSITNHSPGKMSLSLLDQAMRQLLDVNETAVRYVWHGGEPLLAGKDFYREVVSLQEAYPKGRFRNSIQTNATLIDAEWADFFAKYCFGVGVSLDGPAKVHNVHRRDSEQRGSFDRTIAGLLKLREAGVKVSAIAVITKASLAYAKEILQFFLDMKFQTFSLNPLFESDLDFSVAPEEYADFLCEIFDRYATFDDPAIKIEPLDSIISPFIGNRVSRCSHTGLCAKHIVIKNNGAISPCDRFNDKGFEFGNILIGGLSSAIKSEKRQYFIRALKERWQSCSICKWFAFCHGGCTIGYMDKPGTEGNYCKANKRLLQYIEDHFRFEVNVNRSERQPQ